MEISKNIVVLQLASVLSGHPVITVSLIPNSFFFYDFDSDKQIYANKESLNDLCAIIYCCCCSR